MRIYVPQINERSKTLKPWNIFLATINPAFTEKKLVCLDFSKCHFISAEGTAVLSGMKFVRDKKGCKTKIDYNTIQEDVRIVLKRWGFLDLFESSGSGWKVVSPIGTTIPIYKQERLMVNDIVNYIDQILLNRTEMPVMSAALHKEIRRSFFELFGNIFTHSDSIIGGIVCGQVFPKDRKIQIVFYDVGKGIARNVCKAEPSITSDEKAIEWALKRGTSTLSSESVSRGLGLYLIRMFLSVNEGEFRIYANQGAVKEVSGKQELQRLEYPVEGTLIDLRINIRDDVKYMLASEIET